MKKLISALFIISLLCLLVVPVFANTTINITKAESKDISDITFMLNDSYNGVETETQFGWFVPTFTVFRDKGGTINICADSWYFVFNKIQFSQEPIEDKLKATANIKKHMGKIAAVLTKKYPKHKFKGWYETTFTNIHNEELTYRLDNWTNVKDNKAGKKIIWLTELDTELELVVFN